MPQALSDSQKFDLRRQITDYAKSLGFDLVGFSPAKIEGKYLKAFKEWLRAGNEGKMEYMRKIEQRRDINLLLPGAKTVIVFGLNYYHEQPPLPRGHGRIARYAYGRDYHKVIGKKLRKMEEFIAKIYSKIQPVLTPEHADPATPPPIHLTKSYVDTGPLMERALAEQAGIGRIGKNGCVITEKFGSWVFLSEIITTIDLNFLTTIPQTSYPDHQPEKAFPGTESQSVVSFLGSPADLKSCNPREVPAPTAMSSFSSPGTLSRWSAPSQKSFNVCGNCNKCMTACPTGAIIAPGVVDSRLCISYLTIENRKKIPPKLAKIIKKTKRLFGCDICQEVCPHNRARQRSRKIESISTEDPQKNFLDGLLNQIAGDSIPLKKLLAKPISKTTTTGSSPAPSGRKSLTNTFTSSPISSDASFLRAFAGSPLMRAKRRGLQRAAKIL